MLPLDQPMAGSRKFPNPTTQIAKADTKMQGQARREAMVR